MKSYYKLSMDWILLLVLQLIFPASLSGLFTVEVDKSTYTAEFGGDVEMGCSFQPLPTSAPSGIKVTWHWIAGSQVLEVYRMEKGKEDLTSQDPAYRGRARLLKEELHTGWAKLKVSRLRINDSGTYQCFVQTGDGADYKPITLSVIAPFKIINKSAETFPKRGEVLLTCRSEGYPKPSVTWQDGHHRTIQPFKTDVHTADQLFKITSQINVTLSDKNNYTCNFNGHNATFYIPEDISTAVAKNNTAIVFLCLAVTLAAFTIIGVVVKCRQKVSNAASTRNLLVESLGRVFTFPVGIQKNAIITEERTRIYEYTNNDCLKTLLKDQYSEWISTGGRSQDEDELCWTLYNNDGQQLNLQDLSPAEGEVVLLEGPEGSGKTTLAQILISSWAHPSTQSASNHLDLSYLQLIVYVDGSSVKGDLLHEIATQLSCTDSVSTENDYRTILTSGTLLIVDGYKEGNTVFDVSLQRFLLDERGCRALITSRPGHSPKLQEIVGSRATLTLRMKSQKY